MPTYTPLKERIERNLFIEPNCGCWIWLGSLDDCGYGKIGRGKDNPTESLAHRASYTLFIGPIPVGNELDHKCRLRCCVNPYHLESVSHAENVRRGIFDIKRHRNGRKETCKRGHQFSHIEIWHGRPARRCAICRSEAQRRRQLTRKLLTA